VEGSSKVFPLLTCSCCSWRRGSPGNGRGGGGPTKKVKKIDEPGRSLAPRSTDKLGMLVMVVVVGSGGAVEEREEKEVADVVEDC